VREGLFGYFGGERRGCLDTLEVRGGVLVYEVPQEN